MKLYQQLCILCLQKYSRQLQKSLWGFGALGLQVHDAQTDPDLIDREDLHLLRATFGNDASKMTELEDWINRQAKILSAQWQSVRDQDWSKKFKESIQPFALADVWIVPSWLKESFSPPTNARAVLFIDPGLAFGTGHHETTALCIEAILSFFENMPAEKYQNLHVLDAGTGTGILAILAQKLGANKVIGIDNDPKAIEIALQNAEDNKNSTIQWQCDWKNLQEESMDLIVANILPPVLEELCIELSSYLKPSGKIFLSGILKHKEQEVASLIKTYQQAGMRLEKQTEKREWLLISFAKM